MEERQSEPPVADSEALGRRIFSSKQARNKKARWYAFKPDINETRISVDRLSRGDCSKLVALGQDDARTRGADRTFYGWAVVTGSEARDNDRNVTASPVSDNRHHAHIGYPAEADQHDMLKSHATQLAELSSFTAIPDSFTSGTRKG